MNYAVVTKGHIAFFDQYEAALEVARDFNGIILNMWGLIASRLAIH
jgi:hypothetical protein